jgi:hypothetical protein
LADDFQLTRLIVDLPLKPQKIPLQKRVLGLERLNRALQPQNVCEKLADPFPRG